MKSLVVIVIGVMFIALGTGGVVQAVPITFSGEDLSLDENIPLTIHPKADAARGAFLSLLSGAGTEDFESFTDGAGKGGSLPIAFSGAGTATLTDNSFFGGIKVLPPGTTNVGRFPTSGNKYWESGALEDFTITFTDPIAAFGFFGTDIGDPSGSKQLTLTLTDVNGNPTVLNVPHSFPPDNLGGGVLYFAFLDSSNTYTQVKFSNDGGFLDSFGFDDFTIASAQVVPEPNTFLLLGSGLLLFGGFAIWRQKRSRV
jgi:hypothetical protein